MNLSSTTTLAWLRSGGTRQLGYFIAIGVVAGVAARVSYSHIRDVTLIAGQAADVAALLPLSVDGMLMAASLAMSQDKARGLQPRVWARVGFWLGATISVVCNIADTLVHASGTVASARAIVPADMLSDQQLLGMAVFVAVLAPLLLLITVEIMALPGKPIQDGRDVQPTASRRKTEVELLEDRRRRGGYYDKDTAGRIAWSREDNKRQASRRKTSAEVVVPQSPESPRVMVPSISQLAEVAG